MQSPLSLASSFFSTSPDQTAVFAKELAKKVPMGSIICLEGDLGAGKTTFSKAFIAALAGVEEDAVQSPTFIYQNSYACPNGTLHHFDLYRLYKEQEFIELGFLDYLSLKSICIIEWSCRIRSLLKSFILIEIAYISEEERMINIQFIGACPCL